MKYMKKMYRFIKRKLKQINFNLLKLNNKIFVLLNKKHFKNYVAIVSSNKWIYKVREDIFLKIALNKLNIAVDIISWEDKTVDYTKYNMIIVRSIWGYQDKLNQFYNWLDMLKNKKILVYNNINILKDNLNKYKQFSILEDNNIPCIKTKFIFKKDIMSNLSDTVKNVIKEYFVGNEKIVLKPVVSGSGNNTYILENNNEELQKNIIKDNEINTKFNDIIFNDNNGLMIQKFIPEIINGEYSLVYIDKVLTHAAIRYPAIFNSNFQVLEVKIDELDKEIIQLGKQIIKINEYKESLYMRVDIIKTNMGCKIMEVELVDPDLLYSYIKDSKKKRTLINILAKSIIKKL